MSDAPPTGSEDSKGVDSGSLRLSVSEQLELLANERRRWALRFLKGRGSESEPVLVEDVVEHLLSEGLGDDRRNLALALVHVHLPKLASAGVIAYDADRGIVRYRGHEGLERLLAHVSGRE